MKHIHASTKAESDAEGLPPVVSSVKQTSEPASTPEPAINAEQTTLHHQAVSSIKAVSCHSGPVSCHSGTESQVNHAAEPTTRTLKNDVQSERTAPDTEPLRYCGPSHLAGGPPDTHPLDFTVVISPPDLPDSPSTSNGDSQVRYNSSCYSTTKPKSHLDRTPETSRSPESTWLRTPKDGNSYLQLLGNSFETSTAIQTPNRGVSTCAPLVTTTEASGIFERSVSSGPEVPGAFLSLSQILGEHDQSKDEEGIDAVKKTVDNETPQNPRRGDDNDNNGKAGDEASIKSSTPSAWERAMESREMSFQIELEDLKDDHAAEVQKFKEIIAKLEKETESLRTRKSYVAEMAKKNIAKIKEERDNEVIYWTGLLDASESENSITLQEKDEQLKYKDNEIQEKEAIIKRQNDWAVTTAAWNTELKSEYDLARIHEIRPLQQEVARLTALDIENGHKTADQSSQINFLRTTQAKVHDSGAQLLPKLLEACKERDQYRANMQSYGDRYEQTLGDLIAARKIIFHKDQQLQKFNFENEDVPHLTEVAGLLEKTKEAYRVLEEKANECLFREQKIRKEYARAKVSSKLGDERKQKHIDNLEAKIVLLENSNERLIDNLEQMLASTESRVPSLPEGLRQSVDDLRSYISQQEAQLAAQDSDINRHKLTISLHTRLLEEKDSENHRLREANLDAECQIEEILTKADEREIVSTTELEKAVNDIDWLQTQNQNYQSQIRSMTEQGLPVALIEIHQAEVQELQQYVANLENEILQYRAQQHEQINKDWHDANTAALSERATEILRMNWENANEELRKLKNEISILRQGGDPGKFDHAEQMAAEREGRQELEERLEVSEGKLQTVVTDVLTLGKLAAIMWKSLEITWKRHQEHDLLETLGPVEDDINDVIGRYSDSRVEDVRDVVEEVVGDAEPELEDYVDEEEDLDQGLEGGTTNPTQDGNAFLIPSSAVQSSWDSGVTNHYHDQDRWEESHRSARSSSYRPGITFTAPSTSSSRTSVRAFSSSSSGDDSDPEDLRPIQERSVPQPHNSTESYHTISLTETDHRFSDPIRIGNRLEFKGERMFTPNSPTPNYSEHSLIIYQPIEEVEAELMTQSAYDILFPLPPFAELGEQAEWGHESFYAPPEEYKTRGQNTQEQHTNEIEVDLTAYEDDGEQ